MIDNRLIGSIQTETHRAQTGGYVVIEVWRGRTVSSVRYVMDDYGNLVAV